MKLTIIGGGYVGVTVAACLAATNRVHVTCFETDCQKAKQLQAGICPIKEPGLEGLLRQGLETRKLLFTSHVDEAVAGSGVYILAVGTPAGVDGSADLTDLQRAAEIIGSKLNQNALIIIKSTIPPGGTELIEYWITDRLCYPNIHIDVVYSPEFLREGSAVADFLTPQRVVLGGNNPDAMRRAEYIYQLCCQKKFPVLYTTARNAELIKYASNAFLALRVAFINEIAELCSTVGGEIGEVAYGMGLDSRIGVDYFQAGIGFGGSCLPKDLRGLTHFARNMHSPLPILEQVIRSNETHQKWLFSLIQSKARDGMTIGVWGLTFKSGTGDLRQSPALSLIQLFANAASYHFRLYDPNISTPQLKQLNGIEHICVKTPEDAIRDAQILLIMVACEEFKSMSIKAIEYQMQGKIIFDLCRLYPDQLHRPRLKDYWCLGESWKNE